MGVYKRVLKAVNFEVLFQLISVALVAAAGPIIVILLSFQPDNGL